MAKYIARIYTSFDTGSPGHVNYSAGAMLPILQACLEDGYYLPNITLITTSGGWATCTFASDHGMPCSGYYVLIAGADQAAYNGRKRLFRVSSNQAKFAIASDPGNSTGTITCFNEPLGWTKEFTGTNLAVYRAPAGTLRHYIRFDNTVLNYLRGRAYDTMSDVNTGTNAYPSVADQTNGFIDYYGSGTAYNYPWMIIGTDRWISIFGSNGSAYTTTHAGPSLLFFGEINKCQSGATDNYNSFIFGATSASPSSTPTFTASSEPFNTQTANLKAARDISGATIAARTGCYTPFGSISVYGGNTYSTYPDTLTGGLLYAPIYFTNFETSPRGPRAVSPFVGIFCYYSTLNIYDHFFMNISGREGDMVVILKHLSTTTSYLIGIALDGDE